VKHSSCCKRISLPSLLQTHSTDPNNLKWPHRMSKIPRLLSRRSRTPSPLSQNHNSDSVSNLNTWATRVQVPVALAEVLGLVLLVVVCGAEGRLGLEALVLDAEPALIPNRAILDSLQCPAAKRAPRE